MSEPRVAHQGRGAGESVEARLHRIFRERLNVRVPSDEVDVIASGLLDSLGVADLIMSLEEEFGIEIDLADMNLDDFRTMASMARFVQDRRSV